jgi:hypothetical protein
MTISVTVLLFHGLLRLNYFVGLNFRTSLESPLQETINSYVCQRATKLHVNAISGKL